MTYRELIEGLRLQAADLASQDEANAMLDTEICGFEDGKIVFWVKRLDVGRKGHPFLEGTIDVGGN